MSSMTPLRRNAVVALLDAALPNHARLPIMAQSPWRDRLFQSGDEGAG
jgi:hypothetical protein